MPESPDALDALVEDIASRFQTNNHGIRVLPSEDVEKLRCMAREALATFSFFRAQSEVRARLHAASASLLSVPEKDLAEAECVNLALRFLLTVVE